MTQRSDIDIINGDRRYMAELMRAHLERLGVQVRIQHFTGDSSFPTEYRLRYSFVEAVGPTMDMAVVAFVEQLLKHVPVEKAVKGNE